MYTLKNKENTFNATDKEAFDLLVKMAQTIKQQHAIANKYCDFCGVKLVNKPKHLIWHGNIKDLCDHCYNEIT